MIRLALLLCCTCVALAAAPARFISALNAGKPQHLVIYGTSLSKSGAWVPQLQEKLDLRYPGLVTLTNGAKGGQNSSWGRDHVESNVIAHRPDAVFIEFAINDAVTRFNLSVDEVRTNVAVILDRISAALPECEIILQVMNPAVGKAEGDPSHRRNQDAYQQIYRDAARQRGLLLIDHSIAWNRLLQAEGETGFKRYVPDGVHPRAEGYAKFVVPEIVRAIGLTDSSATPRGVAEETDILVYGGNAGGGMAAI